MEVDQRKQILVTRARDMEDDWPSFVVEVGVSESLAMLRRDAAFGSPTVMGELA